MAKECIYCGKVIPVGITKCQCRGDQNTYRFNKDNTKFVTSNFDSKEDEVKAVYAVFFDAIAKEKRQLKYQIQSSIKQTLLTKRNRVDSSVEYAKSLCNNIYYLLESENYILSFINQAFNQRSTYEEGYFNQKLNSEQQIIRQKTPQMTLSYLDDYGFKTKTMNEVVDSLEFDYSYHYVKYDILTDFAAVLCRDPKLFTRLALSSPELNMLQIQSQLNLNTNILLDNIKLDRTNQ